MIREIELTNFQKHKHFKATFTDGVNVFYGESKAGKSCILRGLRWVCTGKPGGDVIRKEGSKETSVKITKDDGTIVERIKSNTKNRYILYVGDEKKEFNTIGKTIPEEIQKVLQITPIEIDNKSMVLNFAEQISLPFLFGESGTFRMKLFNKLTGNNITDKIFQSLNKDLLRIGREEKSEIDNIEKRQKELEEAEGKKEKLKIIYDGAIGVQQHLQKQYDRYLLLLDLKDRLANVIKELANVQEKSKGIVIVDESKIKELQVAIEKIERIEGLKDKYQNNKRDITNTDKNLKDIEVGDIDVTKLRIMVEKYNKAKELFLSLEHIDITLTEDLKSNLEETEKSIAEDGEKYRKVLKEAKICPLCKTKINDEIVNNIKL